MSNRATLSRAIGDVGDLVERLEGRDRVDLSRFADDPVAFATEIGREPVDYQAAVMHSVRDNRFTAWRACHSAGKEHTIGTLAAWGALARGMLVLVISATETQVVGQAMKEVAAAFRGANQAFGQSVEHFRRSVRLAGEDRVISLTGSASSISNLTGWHDPENGVLVLISEGQQEQLEGAAYTAALSNANTERGRILAAGNPVSPAGKFFEINHHPDWQVFRTSAFDTPNVRAGKTVMPGFPGPNWPKEMESQFHGTDNQFYQSRVLAEFPDQAEDALIDVAAVDAAFERYETGELEDEAGGVFTLGLDPAGLGADASALTYWQGPIARRYEKFRGLEATELAEIVEARCRELVDDGPAVSTVYVDEIGIGFGVKSILREALPKITYLASSGSRYRPGVRRRRVQAQGVNISQKPRDTDRFRRRKDELLWALRDRLTEGSIALAPSEELREEILAVAMHQTADGKIEAEPKDQMRARLGRSPDILDSLLLGLSGRVHGGKKVMWI